MTADLQRPVTLRQPARICFGSGTASELPAELSARQAQRVLFVLSSSAARLAQPLLDQCRSQGIEAFIAGKVPPEPTVGDCERLLTEARKLSLDAVVGLGGGSVLDIAKLIAALHHRPESPATFFGNGLLPSRELDLICLPTTAGAGSEVSPNAILYDEADHLKKAVISPWLVPDVAIVDPQLTTSLSPATTAATGLDALTHCIEAYANRHAHPTVDIYALEGIRLISAHLATAVRDGTNLAARSAVALGSLYGGLCLGPVNTAAVHALAYPLGSEFRLAHGLSNALLLPHVIRFNLPAAPARYAAVARALGAPPAADDIATANAGLARLDALCDACGIPRRLSACGVPADAIPRMARDAMKITRLLKNNPREISQSDAEKIYQEAL